jgi:hypothetical protein
MRRVRPVVHTVIGVLHAHHARCIARYLEIGLGRPFMLVC